MDRPPHKSSPPSSPSAGGMSRRISQTRWPHKSRVNVNMVFVIAGVGGFVGRGGGLRVLTGGLRLGQLIIIMLMGRQRILYSARRLLPPKIKDGGPEERKEFLRMTCGQPFPFVRGKFSNSGDHVITLCHNRACVMRYLPCRAWILQMEIRVENCH